VLIAIADETRQVKRSFLNPSTVSSANFFEPKTTEEKTIFLLITHQIMYEIIACDTNDSKTVDRKQQTASRNETKTRFGSFVGSRAAPPINV
jgi:hypothetical protein